LSFCDHVASCITQKQSDPLKSSIPYGKGMHQVSAQF